MIFNKNNYTILISNECNQFGNKLIEFPLIEKKCDTVLYLCNDILLECIAIKMCLYCLKNARCQLSYLMNEHAHFFRRNSYIYVQG